MDIGKNLQASFDLYTKNFGVLFLAGLVTILLSAVTLGILAGPLMGGFIVLCKKLQRGEKGDFNDIFAYMSQIGVLILLTVVIWVYSIVCAIPVLGMLIGIVAGPVFGIVVVLVAGLAVEQNKTVQEGLQFALDKVKANYLQFWVYGFVFELIGGIGAIACGIGALFTIPIGMVGLVMAYQYLTADTASNIPPADNVGPSM